MKQQQRDYYVRTSLQYDCMHLRPGDEHFVALEYAAALLHVVRAKTVLDVGSGTGRAIRFLRKRRPDLDVEGVEPVAELRKEALRHGVLLHEGAGEELPFEDDSFDVVIAYGVMHHLPDPAAVISEMTRVARLGVMISDANRFSQRSKAAGLLKMAIYHLGLWKIFELFRTRGRGYLSSEGDGIFYSYSIFDSIPKLQEWADTVFVIPTMPRRKAALAQLDIPHGLIVAFREPSFSDWAGR